MRDKFGLYDDSDPTMEAELEDNSIENLVVRLTEEHKLFRSMEHEWDETWGTELLVTLNRVTIDSWNDGATEVGSWEVFSALDSFDEDRTLELDTALEKDLIDRCNNKYT